MDCVERACSCEVKLGATKPDPTSLLLHKQRSFQRLPVPESQTDWKWSPGTVSSVALRLVPEVRDDGRRGKKEEMGPGNILNS